MKLFKNVMTDTKGVAAVELGLLLGLIAMAVFGAVQGLGNSVQASFTDTATKVANAS
jgi:Flp pilus assembly pilin Flp